ncbi:MAG TPA: SHOCT domain-containing protein [Arthrobacter sp.]|nr:SHOCT domain-containing protein [Arthrobacter sp.]
MLVLLAVRLFSGGTSRGGPANYGPYGGPPYGRPGSAPGGKSQARLILDERFARGELTAEQYRENLKVLGEEP